jgi:hypothetical protein
MLGTSADVKITSVRRLSVFGEVIEGSVAVKETPKKPSTEMQKECRENEVEEAGCYGSDIWWIMRMLRSDTPLWHRTMW